MFIHFTIFGFSSQRILEPKNSSQASSTPDPRKGLYRIRPSRFMSHYHWTSESYLWTLKNQGFIPTEEPKLHSHREPRLGVKVSLPLKNQTFLPLVNHPSFPPLPIPCYPRLNCGMHLSVFVGFLNSALWSQNEFRCLFTVLCAIKLCFFLFLLKFSWLVCRTSSLKLCFSIEMCLLEEPRTAGL